MSYHDLDPLLHSQLRLAVMSLLVSMQHADFIYLQEKTESTPGNLSVQIDKLQSAGYIRVEKTFVGKKPKTTCFLTDKGLTAFETYVNHLKNYINPQKGTQT